MPVFSGFLILFVVIFCENFTILTQRALEWSTFDLVLKYRSLLNNKIYILTRYNIKIIILFEFDYWTNLSVRKFLWDEESLKVNNKLNLVRGDLKEFKKVFQRVERNAPSYATKLYIQSILNTWFMLWHTKWGLVCITMLNRGLNHGLLSLTSMFFGWKCILKLL